MPSNTRKADAGVHRPAAFVGFLLCAAASVIVLVAHGGFVAWSLGGVLVGLAFLTWDAH